MASSLNGTGVTFSDSTSQASGQQAAKAWLNINGPSGTIRASYGVSSLTRNATGDYTVNFSTAFADANYALVGWASFQTANSAPAGIITYGGDFAPTTTSARVKTANSTNAGVMDAVYACLAFFR